MKIPLVLFCAFLLGSCGKSEDFNETSPYTITSEGTPLVYEMSSNKCSFDYISKNPSTQTFHDGKFNNVILSELAERNLDDSLTLGGEYQINVGRTSTLEEKKSSQDFMYCIDSSVLKNNNSYENAALSILYPIREFKKKYGELFWNFNIPKVKIQVLPKYSRVQTTKVKRRKVMHKSFLINNAMYLGAKDTLIFLPQGRRGKSSIPFGGVPLWKSPAVVMHEYAHHVFNHTVMKNNQSISGFGDSGLCMDTRELNTTSTTAESTASTEFETRRLRTKKDSLEAINEGFSDLFAFYAAGEKKFFDKMGCMSKTRDVQSNQFLSQREKILSRDAMDEFLSTTETIANFCSLQVNFQDPHMIGAIMAHGFYNLLESTKMAPYYKLQVLLLWARDLREIYENSKDSEELFKLALEGFYNKVDTYTGRFQLDCSAYKQVFSFADINC